MVIQVLNLDKLIKKLDKIGSVDVMPVIKDGTRKVQRTAKEIVPVDTSALQTSISTQYYPKELSGVVYTTVEYAPHVEFGTVKMPAQPFLNPAVKLEAEGIKQQMTDHIRKELAKQKK